MRLDSSCANLRQRRSRKSPWSIVPPGNWCEIFKVWAAWPREASSKPRADWIGYAEKDDRNCPGLTLQRRRDGGRHCDDDLRLQRDQLITVIECGVPGTAMPHFDDAAYTDKRCYGMTEAELGSRTPPLPPSTTLVRREVEALTDYLIAKIIGRGPITRAECIENFGERARSCNDYPAEP